MKMLNDNVLLEPIKDNLTAGGIHLPESRQTDFLLGKVIACGPGLLLECNERGAMAVKEGDIVPYIPKKAFDIVVNGKDCVITTESFIVGVV